VYCTNCRAHIDKCLHFCPICGNPIVHLDSHVVHTPDFTDSRIPQILYAGFWPRFFATVIDWALVAVITSSIALPLEVIIEHFWTALRELPPVEHGEVTYELTGLILQSIFPIALWLYYAFFESSRHQATLGKRWHGLYVTDLQGHRISFVRATIRHFGKVISGLTLGI
jgi:uncharacterized RDD family membrane protein YckC